MKKRVHAHVQWIPFSEGGRRSPIPLDMKYGPIVRFEEEINRIEEWTINDSYVYCSGNIDNVDKILYLPWYMIMFYKPYHIPRGMIHKVDISNL